MKRLERPSGHFGTFDPSTFARVEGETRECVHCGYQWIYNPRASFSAKVAGDYKPVTRGICTKCNGMVCGQQQCLKLGCIPKFKQIEIMEETGQAHGLWTV